MEVLKHDFAPYAKIYWDDERTLARIEWIKLFGKVGELKDIPIKALREIEKMNGDTLIVDCYNSTGALTEEFLKFLFEEANPLSLSCGVTKIFTVLPKEVGFASFSIEKWQKEEVDGQERANFSKLEDCYGWIAQHHSQ